MKLSYHFYHHQIYISFLKDSIIAQANHKQITVVFLLTNGLEHCATGQQYNGKMKICRELYEYIAKKTGGQVCVSNLNLNLSLQTFW